MTSIYDQHRAAFANVAAFVVLDNGARVATVAIKYGAAVTAYVHWIGQEMTRGRAGGGGYDRASAACYAAAQRMPEALSLATWQDGTPHHSETQRARYADFRRKLMQDNGSDWSRNLRDAGFEVIQAV